MIEKLKQVLDSEIVNFNEVLSCLSLNKKLDDEGASFYLEFLRQDKYLCITLSGNVRTLDEESTVKANMVYALLRKDKRYKQEIQNITFRDSKLSHVIEVILNCVKD